MAAGIPSLVDYVGYPIGQPPFSPPALCGYRGILDWSMLGCGLAGGVPPTPPSSEEGAHGAWRRRQEREEEELVAVIAGLVAVDVL